MATLPTTLRGNRTASRASTQDPIGMKIALTTVVLLFLLLFLVLPLVLVFWEAFQSGWHGYIAALKDPDAITSIKLTLLIAAIVVPLNTVFGVAAAWAIAKFRFAGRSLLITLIDLPFAVSPVIAGLIFVLVFGRIGMMPIVYQHLTTLAQHMAHGNALSAFTGHLLGRWVDKASNLDIVFAVPGIALATIFVTFPFVARELIPLMESQGTDEEQAAMVLGASGWQAFWRVTVPNIRWGLLYGVVLCNARAMGEFGAVSVVSGHINGQTMTMPLQIQYLYDGSTYVPAFALASLLGMLALITLVFKTIFEARLHRAQKAGADGDEETPALRPAAVGAAAS